MPYADPEKRRACNKRSREKRVWKPVIRSNPSSVPEFRPPKPVVARAYRGLVLAIHDVLEAGGSVPCVGQTEIWTGEADEVAHEDRLEAIRRCQGCPALEACGRYAEVAKPKWGIHAGRWCGPASALSQKLPGRPRKAAAA